MPVLETGFSYTKCVEVSERVSWTLDEVFPPNTTLDSPDDRLAFGNALTERPSGLEYALGRAINIQAILQGAKR